MNQMYISHLSDRIKGVPDRYERAMRESPSFASAVPGGRDPSLTKLRHLEYTGQLSYESIVSVLNDSWVDHKCDHCEQQVDTLIQLGEPSNYESRTVEVCMSCLAAAMRKLEES